MKAVLIALLLLFTTLGLASPALAHTVETNYEIAHKAELKLHSQYSTGEPLKQAPIRVYAPSSADKPWLESTTDVQGQFAFTPDRSLWGEWFVEIGDFTQNDHSDALTVAVHPAGIEVKEIQEKQAQAPAQTPFSFHPQLIVLGFAALSGGIGKLFSSRWR
uniref:YtkA-like domain-containing protein n=1 Tax=Cyanothece sp. (strain PCC 7425 / ATCC 29141) TaxID=395961 RepID=B8HTV2_CYAP4